jgi:hypothetical protein
VLQRWNRRVARAKSARARDQNDICVLAMIVVDAAAPIAATAPAMLV